MNLIVEKWLIHFYTLKLLGDVVINSSYLVLVGQCPFELLIYYPVGMDTLVRERMVRYGRLYCYA